MPLPPCKVCKREATGFHYGVNTCGACKEFFHRAVPRKEVYRCIGTGNCDVTLSRRKSCKSCRYKKCCEVGMSFEAIKTGRYSYKKKSADILELQKLKEEITTLEATQVGSRNHTENLARSEKNSNVHDRGENHDYVISKILAAHQIYTESMFRALRITREDMREYNGNNVFEPVNTLQKSYQDIFETTGIFLCNRPDTIKYLDSTITAFLQCYVNFVENLPGIDKFSLDDKANLIKSARFEFFFLGSYHNFHNRLKLLFTTSGKCYLQDEISDVWGREFTVAVFEMSDSLKTLDLSKEEEILVATMCVLFSDRCELQKPWHVEILHWRVVCALLHHLAKHHSKPALRFAKILDRLTALRSLSEWNLKLENTVRWLPGF